VNAAGMVLGTRERFDTSGKWRGPGGHTDKDESWMDTAVREAFEESGT